MLDFPKEMHPLFKLLKPQYGGLLVLESQAVQVQALARVIVLCS